ncbi:hypothetical protein V5O48_005465 [Marasmius crinis-equi]|uniref:Cytochrome P450 n=1 Tax=Marasmius crinis-equi TaxID=585013 RepID=A0ABR3FM78_9AGAR
MQQTLLFTFGLAVCLLLLLRRFGAGRSRLPYPPGPKGLPIVGNIHDVQPKSGSDSDKRQADSRFRWERYLDWSRQYNSPDIVSVHVFGERMVVLNSRKAVEEVLEKRSANYSDRPAMHMTNDLSGWAWDFAHMRYSDWWRLHRKTFHQYFQARAMPEYYDIQREATEALIRKLTTSPADYYDHVRQQVSFSQTSLISPVLKIVYGYQPQDSLASDPYVKLANSAIEGIIETAIPGAFLVDFFPALKFVPSWLPGAGFKRKAQVWKKYCLELRDRPWEWLKSSIVDGTAEPSFASRNLEKLASSITSDSDREAMEEVIKGCSAISYLAGSDTTVSVLLSFILNMMKYPEIQSRAQAEVDSVVASLGRLPEFGDQSKLPYVDAVLAETLRRNTVTPLALPHAALEDDVYEGYWIPKGSTIVGNAWAILHDEDLYGPEPMKFNPDRFMKQDGKERPPHPERYAFGFGRR